MEEMDKGPSFSIPKDNQIYIEDIIMIFKKQLKAGLHERASILLNLGGCKQFVQWYQTGFKIGTAITVLRPRGVGVRLCKTDSEGKARNVVG